MNYEFLIYYLLEIKQLFAYYTWKESFFGPRKKARARGVWRQLRELQLAIKPPSVHRRNALPSPPDLP